MKRPTSINILGHDITIKYADCIGEEDDCIGCYYDESKLIIIKKHRNWKCTLLHELMHAALTISGTSHRINLKDEENLCVLFENTFSDIFKFNNRSDKICY